MENYISLFIAILEENGQFTAKEAEAIDKALRTSTIPGNYKEAKEVIKTIFEKIRSK